MASRKSKPRRPLKQKNLQRRKEKVVYHHTLVLKLLTIIIIVPPNQWETRKDANCSFIIVIWYPSTILVPYNVPMHSIKYFIKSNTLFRF